MNGVSSFASRGGLNVVAAFRLGVMFGIFNDKRNWLTVFVEFCDP